MQSRCLQNRFVERLRFGRGGYAVIRTDVVETPALRKLFVSNGDMPCWNARATKPFATRNRRHRLESFRLEGTSTDVVCKTYSLNPGHSLLRKVEAWLVLTFLKNPARRAFVGAMRLSAAGLRTAEPLAFGCHCRRGLLRERFFLYRRIEAIGSLRDVQQGACDPVVSLETLLDCMAEQVRTLHAAGLRHGDLALGNWLLGSRSGNGALPDLCLIDVDRVRRAWKRPVCVKRFFDLRSVARINISDAACYRIASRYLGADFSENWWRVCRFWRPNVLRGDFKTRAAKTQSMILQNPW